MADAGWKLTEESLRGTTLCADFLRGEFFEDGEELDSMPRPPDDRAWRRGFDQWKELGGGQGEPDGRWILREGNLEADFMEGTFTLFLDRHLDRDHSEEISFVMWLQHEGGRTYHEMWDEETDSDEEMDEEGERALMMVTGDDSRYSDRASSRYAQDMRFAHFLANESEHDRGADFRYRMRRAQVRMRRPSSDDEDSSDEEEEDEDEEEEDEEEGGSGEEDGEEMEEGDYEEYSYESE